MPSSAIRASLDDLLIIDEVEVSFSSETEKILLYQIINGRYEKSLPTILCSNLNFKDLVVHCGERVKKTHITYDNDDGYGV